MTRSIDFPYSFFTCEISRITQAITRMASKARSLEISARPNFSVLGCQCNARWRFGCKLFKIIFFVAAVANWQPQRARISRVSSSTTPSRFTQRKPILCRCLWARHAFLPHERGRKVWRAQWRLRRKLRVDRFLRARSTGREVVV